TEQVMSRELGKLGSDSVVPRRHSVDHRVRVARQGHRVRLDQLTLPAPLLRNRLSQRLRRYDKIFAAGRLDRLAIEPHSKPIVHLADVDLLVELLHAPLHAYTSSSTALAGEVDRRVSGETEGE